MAARQLALARFGALLRVCRVDAATSARVTAVLEHHRHDLGALHCRNRHAAFALTVVRAPRKFERDHVFALQHRLATLAAIGMAHRCTFEVDDHFAACSAMRLLEASYGVAVANLAWMQATLHHRIARQCTARQACSGGR